MRKKNVKTNFINPCNYFYHKDGVIMNLELGDIVVMKKPHPCGSKEFEINRLGVDYKLKCCGCGREVMIPRIKAEKNIKAVKKNEQ